jgi:ring-1,2-phenylacetyl-CoA epoxidase subunit PaaD
VVNSLSDSGVDADGSSARTERAWRALNSVEDPELPGLLITDLGIIRHVAANIDGVLEVGLSPTYSGCPASNVIRTSVVDALDKANIGRFRVQTILAPAWSSDWITDQGRRKLLELGIVSPDRTTALTAARRALKPIACPRCDSLDTECISEFGSTPCKALHRCRSCLEPFEYFKCI